jgi:PAS domain S-box-containing protein
VSGSSPADEAIRQKALEASEGFARGLLAAVPAGVVHVQADGSIVNANAEALRLLGLRYEELTKRYVTDFETTTVWEDGSPCPASDYPVTRALMTGEAQPAVTIGVRRPAGDVAWCVFRAVPVRDAAGATTGAVVTFHDITDRKRIEDALRKSEAELKAIVTSAPSIIFTADREGRLTFVNRTERGLAVEVDPASVIGQSVFEWTNEADHPMLRDRMRRVLELRETVEYEVEGLAGVDPNSYSTRIGPILRGDEVVGIAGVVTTLTERKKVEAERARLLAELHDAQRLEALGRLAGGVAHDFNNLLTVIQSAVDLMRARPDPSQQDKRLAEIAAAAERASSLTRQLLAFGRQQNLAPRVLSLAAVVDGILPLLRRLLGEHVSLEVVHVPGLGSVRADAVQLERVLVNLLTNAEAAMPAGGTIDVRTESVALAEGEMHAVPAGRYAALRVRDTGEGMDADVVAHAFEPFFTTKPAGKGSGLGLATVYGIVKQSGGHVVVQSDPGRGTCFTVLLPEVDELPEPLPAPPPPSRRRGDETVLIVEDEQRVRDVAKRILVGEGYTVIVAESAEQALSLGDELLGAIDLLLTDVVMPGMNGLALAERIRQRSPRVRVLLMSGYVHETVSDLPEAFEFLAKPFGLEALCAAVRRLLDARRQAGDVTP